MMMKFALAVACLMMLTWVEAAPQAGPPPLEQKDLAPWCRDPQCPDYLNVKLPHRMDCLLYLECTQGVGKVKACPPDQHYNEEEKDCTHRSTANCVPCWQKAPQ